MLNQVTNLETHDLCPLVAAGCFTLVVLYSRILCLQIMQLISSGHESAVAQGKSFSFSPAFDSFRTLISNPSVTLELWKVCFDAVKEDFKVFPMNNNKFSSLPFENCSRKLMVDSLRRLDLSPPLANIRSALILSPLYHRPPDTVRRFLHVLVAESTELGSDPRSESTSYMSGARELEERILRQAGVTVNNDPKESTAILARRMLALAVEDCLSAFEMAATGKDIDWISYSVEEEAVSSEGKPRVLLSYFIIESLIILEAEDASHRRTSFVATPVVLSRLVKLSSCPNSSLKVLLLDLASQILLRVIQDIYQLENHTHELKLATEYYLSIVKDHGLVNALDTSLKAECAHGFRPSRLSKVSLNLLLQCQLMRRQLRLDTSNPAGDAFTSELAEVISSCKSFEDGNRLRVNQIGSHNCVVSWSIDVQSMDGEDASYYSIQAISMSGGSSTLLLNCIDLVGQYRLERLFANSFYKICLIQSKIGGSAYSSNDEGRINSLLNGPSFMANTDDTCALADRTLHSVCFATEAELLLTLDSTWMSSNLRLVNNVSVKNSVNKKWSSVRCGAKMMSGVHVWDVMIDRCISKNIFIGVVSPEAKKDNYVGCDRHGWAFLANRAVWHNKSKTRSYGELFRSGDIVTATLDLDRGTLGFKLNSVDLGIAVTGLTPPLFAAFSLYNEGSVSYIA